MPLAVNPLVRAGAASIVTVADVSPQGRAAGGRAERHGKSRVRDCIVFVQQRDGECLLRVAGVEGQRAAGGRVIGAGQCDAVRRGISDRHAAGRAAGALDGDGCGAGIFVDRVCGGGELQRAGEIVVLNRHGRRRRTQRGIGRIRECNREGFVGFHDRIAEHDHGNGLHRRADVEDHRAGRS